MLVAGGPTVNREPTLKHSPTTSTCVVSRGAAGRTSPRRKALYGQIEDIILDESAAMTVSLYPQTGLATSNVRGLDYDSRPALSYATAWLAT